MSVTPWLQEYAQRILDKDGYIAFVRFWIQEAAANIPPIDRAAHECLDEAQKALEQFGRHLEDGRLERMDRG